MRRFTYCKLVIMVIIFAGGIFFSGVSTQGFTGISSADKMPVLSRIDLRRYFEKAMDLFESGRYKEAIMIFKNLIEIEKSQHESYFTPFAEIYIEKANKRMRELLTLEDKKWERMKKEVISEAEKIAANKIEKLARQQKERRQREEEVKRQAMQRAKKDKEYQLQQQVQQTYEEAMKYYKEGKYPQAIVKFKRVKELDPRNRLVAQAEGYIKKSRSAIKAKEQRELLARMEAARRAQLELERDRRRREIEREKKRMERARLERQKQRLKYIFKERLKARMVKQRLARIDSLMDTIRGYVKEKDFEQAEKVLEKAIQEFPRHERFKDVMHYVRLQKIKMEEKALKRTREIVEEKMLLEVAKKHILPKQTIGKLKREKKITTLVKVPEIRKRLKIPISVDFKDVELDYVLSFLSDATGVNIVPSSQIDMSEKKVTIKIKDMPLEDALRYILKTQDLVYRVEEDAVWVTTEEELETETIETRVYFLNSGVGRFAEFTGQKEGTDTGSSEVKTIKDLLENVVDWPKDSKLTLDDRTGALIISNTPSNLETIENLLYNLDVTPIQVLIEARFLEVQVTDVDELGLEWKLNSAWGVKQNNAKQNLHGFASGSGVDFSSFTRADEGFNLTYQGILSHPQFQMVMHALKEKQNVKTLSAPRITTLNNQTATIEVTDEFIYPTRYEVSLVQYDINGDGDFDDAGETEWTNIPQDFVTRDVGILLHVKPSVGADKKTITLALTPEVSEDAGTFTYSGDVTIPQFRTRNLSTSVIMQSGETVVLGGLVKETNTKVKTEVPLLGDLPLVGGLFRKNTENVERRNLLIFVTATVLNDTGSVVASSQDIKPDTLKP